MDGWLAGWLAGRVHSQNWETFRVRSKRRIAGLGARASHQEPTARSDAPVQRLSRTSSIFRKNFTVHRVQSSNWATSEVRSKHNCEPVGP